MSGEAVKSAENSGKHLAGRDSAQNPAGELTALPSPMIGGEGLAAPLQDPTPALGFRPRFSVLLGLIQQPPQQSSFPQCLIRGRDKTL